MKKSVVDRIAAELAAIGEVLDRQEEVSLRIAAEEIYRKALLLAAASLFEAKITEAILEHVEEASSSQSVVSFVRNKGLKRQYHTLFNWEAKNVNQFFGLFGDAVKRNADSRLHADEGLSRGAVAFLRIGRERNLLVHQDFGSYSLGFTTSEILSLYSDGMTFVSAVPDILSAPYEREDGDEDAQESSPT